VALTFGLISVVLSGLVGAITFRLAADFMLEQRLQRAELQATVNLRAVAAALGEGSGVDDVLTGITGDPGSAVVVMGPDGRRVAGDRTVAAAAPADLFDAAATGTTVTRSANVAGLPILFVAMPTPVAGVTFVEAFPLVELNRVYRFLTLVIVGGVLVSGVLGIVLGRWLASRALRPLTELTASAGRVAAGDLSARIPEQQDPDLAALAATFNETATSLERRVAADTRFAADVSHELRSPLTTMTNAVEVLARRRDDLPPTSRRAVDLLSGEVDRFRRLVVDLLEISRTDEAAQLQAEPVDVGVLITALAGTHPGAPEPEIGPGSLIVTGDRRRLARTVANLLDNAEKYGDGAIRLAAFRHGDVVRIEVDDAGPGVPAGLRDQVFERFTRGQYAGQRQDDTGTGLGLALVARHVRLHGGRAWVQDRPGGGARFVVELPG